MTLPLELHHGALRLSLRPDLGGCIEGLWCGDLPVLRSSAPGTLADVRDSSSFPLAPFSNRLARAQLDWKGTPYPLCQNLPGEPHSIHGLGWQRGWQVQVADADAAILRLAHAADAAWPFAFDASQTVRLQGDWLELTLAITNQSGDAAPVGLGWHPYFVKRSRSRLAFTASGRWEMGSDKIPTTRSPVSGLDTDCAPLDIDHCFDGWRGPLHLRDERLHITLSSSLQRLVVYTTPEQDFVAIEPVSHVNNAMNQGDSAQALGVQVLAAGQSWSASMHLKVEKI